MAEIVYTSTVHPTEEMVLDAAAENLQPNSVWLPLCLSAAMPGDTRNKDFRKKGKLVREVLTENEASTYQAYTETKTQLTAVKSVVSVRMSVENLEFDAVGIPSVIGEEAGKAFALGIDQDISDLIISATKTVNQSGATFLKYIDILVAALKVRTAINGQDEPIAAVLHLKQIHEAFGEDLLALSGAVFGNQAVSLGQAADNTNKGAGFIGNFGGINTYQTGTIDTQAVSTVSSYVGAVFAPSRALVAMVGKYGSLQGDDTENIRKARAYYVFSDSGIHWDEAICSLTSQVA